MRRRWPHLLVLLAAPLAAPLAAVLLAAAFLPVCGCSSEKAGLASAFTRGHGPEGLQQATAELQKGVLLISEGKYQDALTAIFPQARVFKSSDRPDLAAEALFWTAFAHEKLGEGNDAQVFYSQVIQEYPDTPAAAEARRRLAEAAPPAAP